LKAKPEQKC